ncbi:hypothetical protein CAOG_04013 [Capsaspora owczarzaki ATCC 30864]|uniref:cholesterol 7-desaturase n=1 Tax=Capsaspora owczarzaki (strain ATCC 30864) TaxID=595528 RepID=A0A0D2WQI5_CAPO3|nr:hypothetical protein CAOG_04013 [Capsaspora owczarzaki ATCC 30864]KJE93188.1 hypothetical protein CAOG_004013 [Capsaspora owczarzaki ATCC 30864]|eukprot:XP_004347838.1 hypothetical protein CAOG_04013 [Capsaspora owczarzaki ATCC 30864]
MIPLEFWVALFAALVNGIPELDRMWFKVSFGLLVLLLAYRFWVAVAAPIVTSHNFVEHGGGATKRVAGKTPPPYPNGWFCVLYQWELTPGSVKTIQFMGKELVAFRGKETGVVSVLDAYCPHLGANLGISGRVKGDCLECPFHGWRYDGSGQCAHIPSQATIPAQAHTRAWPVLERNQMILVWYHVDETPPTWMPDVIDEVHSKAMRFDAKSDYLVQAHVQEIPENTADVAHLNVLHHLPWNIPIVEDHFRVDWQGWWRPGDENDPHCAHVPVTQALVLFGKQIPYMHMTTQIHLIGPGLVLYLFETPVGRMRLFETVTPAGPLLQKVSLVMFSKSWTIRWLTKWFYRGVAKTLSQDCWIWNNKTYYDKPTFSKGDRYLLTFRKWYSQFWSERSISMRDASRSGTLEW